MARMSNSWAMLKASATVLRLDTELLIFPLLSTLAVILITVSLVALIMFFGGPAALEALDGPGYLVYSGGFVFYLILYTVIFFFNAGLVGATLIRLDGGDPTVGDGMNIATNWVMTTLTVNADTTPSTTDALTALATPRGPCAADNPR